MNNAEIPKSTSILTSADGEVEFSPYAFCLEAQNGNVTFTTLNENTDAGNDVAAQPEGATLIDGKRLYGRYVRVEVASGELICYEKNNIN